MDGEQAFEIEIHHNIHEITPQEWDRCADAQPPHSRPINPFTTHRFLNALEESGSASAKTGWAPHHLLARMHGKLVGVAPLYLKSHSQGEYIFDHSWADAFERAGGQYYPKLLIAVPFTPATGERFLVCDKENLAQVKAALMQGATQIADQNNISSLHINFCAADEAKLGTQLGLLHRQSQQFHWKNDSYRNFDDFLNALSSRKRKQIRKERKQACNDDIEIVELTGEKIAPQHWDAFWRFYQDTGARKWGTPYLTRQFFELMHRDMRDDILLVLAKRNGEWIAGALNFIGKHTLFGRYWGCTEHHPSLHFELCYYRAIDWAIQQGLSAVEAGAQGDHKLARGYLPIATHSLHWIGNESFREAVSRFLRAESRAVEEDIEWLNSHSPFRASSDQELEEHD